MIDAVIQKYDEKLYYMKGCSIMVGYNKINKYEQAIIEGNDIKSNKIQHSIISQTLN